MTRPSFSRYGLPILALLGLAFAIWVVLQGKPDREMNEAKLSPPRVPSAQMRGGTVSGAGIVEPSSEVIALSPLVPGVLTQVTVTAGDRVAKGQLLMALDDRDVRARLMEAKAGLDYAGKAAVQAKVDVETARRQLQLVLGVSDPAAVSEQQRVERRQALAAAEARAAVAASDVMRARAAVASAETEISRRVVLAPRAGEILQVRTRVGEYVTAGPGPGASETPISMGETRPLHVRIDIDETEIGRVQPGAAAVVSPRGRALSQVTATFVRMEPLVVPKRSLTNTANERVDVRVLQLIYALPLDAQGFAIGQQVDAFLPARDEAAAAAATKAAQ